MKRYFLILPCLLVLTACGSKSALEPPELAPLIKQAKAGDPDAQFELFEKYRGMGEVKGSREEAAKWCIRAAEQGHPAALGFAWSLYDNGKGVPQDAAKALEWMLKAAEAGETSTQLCRWIGERYEKGRGTAKDPAQAVRWYEEAAELGDSTSAYRLGVMHRDGEGTAPDPVQAYDWFYRAIELGRDGACFHLAKAHLEGAASPQDPLLAYAWLRMSYSFSPDVEQEARAMRKHLGGILTEAQQKEALQRTESLKNDVRESHRQRLRKRAEQQAGT